MAISCRYYCYNTKGLSAQMDRTCEQKAFEDLRQLIVSRRLPIGEFLSQRKLAGMIGCSVITLRAALRRLESDGLIENVPRWGVRIPAETAEQLRDRYFLREVLEVAAARRAAERMDGHIATRLRSLARTCDALAGAAEPDARQFAEAQLALHHYIAECSGSRLLMELLDRLSLRSLMRMNAAGHHARGADRRATRHQDLAEAILSGDPDEAEAAVREHVQQNLQNELERTGQPDGQGSA